MSCLLRFLLCAKDHDQKKFGEERVCFILHNLSLRNNRAELSKAGTWRQNGNRDY